MATPEPLTPAQGAPSPGPPSTLAAIGNVVGASVAGRFLRFVKVLAVARLLSPESYGAFVTLTVLINYSQFLELGGSTAAFRDLATAFGRGDAREAARAASRMATLKLAAALLLGCGSLAAAFWPGLPAPLHAGLLAMPAIALSAALLSQALLHLQAEGRAKEYGRVTVIAAATDLVLCTALTAAWGLPGLLAASAVSPAGALAWAWRRRALARPRPIEAPVLRRTLRTGVSLAAIALVEQSLLSVDQLLILAFLPLADLGLYNVAFVLAEGVRTLGTAASTVLGPRLLREHARAGGSLPAIRRHTLEPVLLFARALPLPVTALWVAGGFLLTRFYPAYVRAVEPMHVLLVATMFLVVPGGVTLFLFAQDKQSRNLLLLVCSLGLNAAVDLLLLRLGWGLMAIAAGSLVTYAAYAVTLLWYVSGQLLATRWQRLAFLGRALLPAVGLAAALATLERFVDYRHSLPGTLAVGAVGCLLCAPLALGAARLAFRLDEAPAPAQPRA